MESHLDQPLLFKIRKVARYTRLFGPSRTWVKVMGQYHLKRTTPIEGKAWINPRCDSTDDPDRFVGLIGCGNFPYCNIAYYLRKTSRRFLRATYDLSTARARSLCGAYGGAYAAGDVDQLLSDPYVKLIYIASNHASHAEYAIRALDAGKHVHIEKPHVVSLHQLERLSEAQRRNPDCMVFLGFNRPQSSLFRHVSDVVAAQSGPAMINWFVAGHKIPEGHWYFSESEGGRILGNLCHWTDLTLHLVGVERAFPCEITAVAAPAAKSDFSISIAFADNSIAGITFSAKGHTFEGVREVLNAHRGDVLVALSNFHTLRIDRGHRIKSYRSLFRDHGHRRNIDNSFDAVRDGDRSKAVAPAYIEATARLFLGVKAAVDQRKPVIIAPWAALG